MPAVYQIESYTQNVKDKELRYKAVKTNDPHFKKWGMVLNREFLKKKKINGKETHVRALD